MSGLPRSGSTLLSAIMHQNPDIYAGPSSPMCGMMFNLEASILASEQYSAFPKPEVLPQTVYGVLEGYYSDTDRPNVIDKSRSWAIQEHFNVLKRNLPYEPKIILTVRTITDILASFISLVNKNPGSPSFMDLEIQARQDFHFYRPVNDIRCDHLMRPKGLVDDSLYGIAFAMLEENRNNFHLVEYEDLLHNPNRTLDGIYKFLELPRFEHDLDNIAQELKEDDKVFGLEGMHDVRPSLSPRKINTEKILSPYVLNKYSNMEFWRANSSR